jgi:nucleoside-diphosphate-sugar epimerase
MKPKILICGATGFIGRNLSEHFARRGSCHVQAVYFRHPPVKIKGATWRKADLRNPADVEKAVKGVDIIIQAAATTSGVQDIITRPYIHVTDNAVMNSYLLRAALRAHVKHFVFFSCSVMYPSAVKPLKEDDWDRNIPVTSPYFAAANTKLYIEKMCEFYASLGSMKCTVIRHSNIFGPHDKFDLKHSHFIGAMISKIMTAREEVSVWGTGREARDLLYVGDLVRFVDLTIRKQPGKYGLYNCGMGRAHSIRDLVDISLDASGRQDLAVKYDHTKPSIRTSVSLNCARAGRELGWRPLTPLAAGIKKTLAWWKENINPHTLRPYSPT